MILSFCPGGATASLLTNLARGDAALSVTLTAVSSLITLVSTPFGLYLVLTHYQFSGIEVDLPIGKAILILLVITIIPIGIGMLVRRLAPRFR